MAKQLILVDTLSLLYRGHFAMLRRPLKGRDGTVTSGLSFLLNELLSLSDKYPEALVYAISDAPGGSFRNSIYPEYKANRPPTPQDLRTQTELARKIIPMLGIPFIEKKGLEADDIIAGFAGEALGPVVILSPDKDLLQLITDNVSILRPGKFGRGATLIKLGEVSDVMGVPAKYIADLLAIMGDSSDNIPGAKGIGAKGAAKLIQQFGGIEDIYKNIDSVSSKSLHKKLIESKDAVFLSYSLTKLSNKLPDDLKNYKSVPVQGDDLELKELLKRLSLNKIADKFNISYEDDDEKEELLPYTCDVHIIKSLDDVELPGDGPVCIDTETTSLDPILAKLIGFSICVSPKESWYLPFSQCASQSEILKSLEKLLNKRGYIAQNSKFDSRVLKNHGVFLPAPSDDTYLADYILRPDARSHALKRIVPEWLGRSMKTYDEVTSDSGGLIDTPIEEVAEYCSIDSTTTFALREVMLKKLDEDKGMKFVYNKVELPLSSVLADMEETGIGLNKEILGEENNSISKRIFVLMDIARTQAGKDINFASPKQVSTLLFDSLGLKPIRKTSKGTRSTDMNVLLKLRNEHPVVETLIEFRELSKLQNTYVKKLPTYINPKTGLIHTHFNQAVTATGRLSSSNPNLQNIPIKTERGRRIRKCFIPPYKAHNFVTADYSQIELRVMAHLAGPGALREAYQANEDLHSVTAEALFGEVTPENRRKAKEVNFSIIYGISAYGLSSRLSIPIGEASTIISKYFEKYPEVKIFNDLTIKSAIFKSATSSFFQANDFSSLIFARRALWSISSLAKSINIFRISSDFALPANSL